MAALQGQSTISPITRVHCNRILGEWRRRGDGQKGKGKRQPKTKKKIRKTLKYHTKQTKCNENKRKTSWPALPASAPGQRATLVTDSNFSSSSSSFLYLFFILSFLLLFFFFFLLLTQNPLLPPPPRMLPSKASQNRHTRCLRPQWTPGGPRGTPGRPQGPPREASGVVYGRSTFLKTIIFLHDSITTISAAWRHVTVINKLRVVKNANQHTSYIIENNYASPYLIP